MSSVCRVALLSILCAIASVEADQAEDLSVAAAQGDIERLQELLAKGADPNARGSNNATALMNAVYAGKIDAVKFLISKGADVDATFDRDGIPITALSVASEKLQFVRLSEGSVTLNLMRRKSRNAGNVVATDIARALLAAGASIEKSPSYLDPDFLEKAPATVAIIHITDERSDKRDEERLRDKMASGFASQLAMRGYKVTKYRDARQKSAPQAPSA